MGAVIRVQESSAARCGDGGFGRLHLRLSRITRGGDIVSVYVIRAAGDQSLNAIEIRLRLVGQYFSLT